MRSKSSAVIAPESRADSRRVRSACEIIDQRGAAHLGGVSGGRGRRTFLGHDECAGFLPNRRLVLVTKSLACNAGGVRK